MFIDAGRPDFRSRCPHKPSTRSVQAGGKASETPILATLRQGDSNRRRRDRRALPSCSEVWTVRARPRLSVRHAELASEPTQVVRSSGGLHDAHPYRRRDHLPQARDPAGLHGERATSRARPSGSDISTVSVHRALHSLETGTRCALFRLEGRNLHPDRRRARAGRRRARRAARHVGRHPARRARWRAIRPTGSASDRSTR